MSGFRVRNAIELEQLIKKAGLNKSIAQQIKTELVNVSMKRLQGGTGGSPNGACSNVEIACSGRHKRFDAVSTDQALRKTRSEYYTLPEYDINPDPAVVLYRACVARWGRYYEGGLVLSELMIKEPRSFLLDIALVNYRIAIEFDGYQFHSSLDATKNDHAKSEQFGRLGWIIFRIGKQRVMKDLDSFLDSIEQAMKNVPSGTASVRRFKGTRQRASFNSLLLRWEPGAAFSPPTYQWSGKSEESLKR